MAAATSQSSSARPSAQEDRAEPDAALAPAISSQGEGGVDAGEHAEQQLRTWHEMSAGHRAVCVVSVLVGASAGVAVLCQEDWYLFLRVVHKLGYRKGRIEPGSRATELHRLFDYLNKGEGVAAMKGIFPLHIHAWLQHFGNDGVKAIERVWPGLGRRAVAIAVAIVVAVLTYKALQSIRRSKWFCSLQNKLSPLIRAIHIWVYAKSQAWRSRHRKEVGSQSPTSSVSTKEAPPSSAVMMAGTGAVVGGVAAPAAAVSAVTAAGFGSGGIVGGSLAASAMSASGGAVASGSGVAICQSIGATGSLLAGAGVAWTAGVVLGGALLTGATVFGACRLYTRMRAGGVSSSEMAAQPAAAAAASAAPAASRSSSHTDVTILSNPAQPNQPIVAATAPAIGAPQAPGIEGAAANAAKPLSMEELGWDAELELPELASVSSQELSRELAAFDYQALLEALLLLSTLLQTEFQSGQQLIIARDFTAVRFTLPALLPSSKLLPPPPCDHRCRL